MRCVIRIATFLFIASVTVNGQLLANEVLLKAGIAELESGSFDQAAETFQSILNDIDLAELHADAHYWLVKTEILLEKYDSAMNHVEKFFAFFPHDKRVIEMKYQYARLFFLQGYPEKALIALGRFIVNYPTSRLVPSARYWIGESLIVLGRLEEAEAVFNDLIETHPRSVKREAARYRINEIAFHYRERTLLELLRWSHERYLEYAEDLQRQRVEYYEAVKGLNTSNSSSNDRQVEEKLIYMERLLKARGKLLDMKVFYINELMELQNDY